jgi:hypothetical protein
MNITRGPPQRAGISVGVGVTVGVGVRVLVGIRVNEMIGVAVEELSGLICPQPRSRVRRTQQNNELIGLKMYEDL